MDHEERPSQRAKSNYGQAASRAGHSATTRYCPVEGAHPAHTLTQGRGTETEQQRKPFRYERTGKQSRS